MEEDLGFYQNVIFSALFISLIKTDQVNYKVLLENVCNRAMPGNDLKYSWLN